MLLLTYSRVGFHSRSKIRPVLMLPSSSEGEKTSFVFISKKSINEERSFYRLMSYAKKNCQDLQTLTFVAFVF